MFMILEAHGSLLLAIEGQQRLSDTSGITYF